MCAFIFNKVFEFEDVFNTIKSKSWMIWMWFQTLLHYGSHTFFMIRIQITTLLAVWIFNLYLFRQIWWQQGFDDIAS